MSFKKFQASGELSKLKMVRKAFVFQDTVFITSEKGTLGKIYKDSVYYWSKEYEANKLVTRVHQLPNGNLLICLNDGRIILKTPHGDSEVEPPPAGSRIAYIFNVGSDVRFILYSEKREPSTWRFDQKEKRLKPLSLIHI